MAVIMMAIGALLALVGLYALAAGYPVIEVERGWAMVIAGAVLLTGGLIVVALGIVVRTLSGLKAGFVGDVPIAHADPILAASDLGAPAVPTMSDAGFADAAPASAVAAPAAAAALAEASEPKERRTLPRIADLGIPPARPEPVEPEPAVDREPAAADPLWHDRGFSAFDLEPEPVPPPPTELSAAEPETRATDSGPHEPPAEAHADEPVYEAPAFEEASHEEPAHEEPTHEEPPFEQPNAEPPRVAEHEPEALLSEAAYEVEPQTAHTPEPPAPDHPAEAPSTAPEVPPSQLAVIGRYDSDGTSYVMYSDGSIEAQSGTNVVRFGSMAELKAYIEG